MQSHMHTRWALTQTHPDTQSRVPCLSLPQCRVSAEAVTELNLSLREKERLRWFFGEGGGGGGSTKYSIWWMREQERTSTHLSVCQLQRVFTDFGGHHTTERRIACKCCTRLMHNAYSYCAICVYIMADDVKRCSTTMFLKVGWDREECYWHIDVICFTFTGQRLCMDGWTLSKCSPALLLAIILFLFLSLSSPFHLQIRSLCILSEFC